jgi:hypothetical protein
MKINWHEVTWYSKLIAVILFVATFFLGFYFGTESQKIKNTPIPEIKEIVVVPKKEVKIADGKYCFYRKQIATEAEPYSSEESVVLNILNNIVTGTKTGVQSGPGVSNGFKGSLTGSVKDGEIEVVYAYTVEGSSGKEVEIYTFEGIDLTKLRYRLIDNFDGELTPDRLDELKRLVYVKSNCEVENQKVEKKENILNSDFELAS